MGELSRYIFLYIHRYTNVLGIGVVELVGQRFSLMRAPGIQFGKIIFAAQKREN